MPAPTSTVITRQFASSLRDTMEERLSALVTASMKKFLSGVRDIERKALRDKAVSPTSMPTTALGDYIVLWTALVCSEIIPAMNGVIQEAFRDTALGSSAMTAAAGFDSGPPPAAGSTIVLSSQVSASADYLAAFSDRLVQGLVPPLPQDAFNQIRSVLATGQIQGWTVKQTSERIAATLDWDGGALGYWQKQKAGAVERISSILDPLGPPGSLAREHARMNDPVVSSLQDDASHVQLRLDATESYWGNRATLIARTEGTGAANYASIQAIAREGNPSKKWCSAHDDRTRPTHADADGQVVPVDQPFSVGSALLMHPGDPSGPADEVCACRCFTIAEGGASEEGALGGEGGEGEGEGEGGFGEADLGGEALGGEALAGEEAATTTADVLSNLDSLSTSELETLLDKYSASGDWQALEQVSDHLDAREAAPAVKVWRPDPASPFNPKTYEWYEAQSEEEQDRFLEDLGRWSPDFQRDQYAHIHDLSSARAARAELPTERQMRAEWDAWVDREWQHLEEETKGNTLNHAASAAGHRAADL